VPKPLTAAQLQRALERVLSHPAPLPASSVLAVTPGLSDSRDRTIRRPSVSAAMPVAAGDHADARTGTAGLGTAAGERSDPVAPAAAMNSNDSCLDLQAPVLPATSSAASAGSVLALQSGACTASSPAH